MPRSLWLSLPSGAVIGWLAGLWQISRLRYGFVAADQRPEYWAFFIGIGLLGGIVGMLLAAALRRRGGAVGQRIGAFGGLAATLCFFLLFVPGNTRELPHVLLLVTDSTRADHLSLYGYKRDTTPCLEELAGESVVFQNAMSQGSSTIVTTPCLLASCYPSDHGLVSYRRILNERFRLVSEVLHDAGYSTFGVVTNPHLDAANGFDQGFDVYERIGIGTQEAVFADTVHTRAVALADSLTRSSSPTFGFLFYTDTHVPYWSPKEYWRLYDKDWPEREPTFGWNPKTRGRPSQRTLFNLIAQYDASIRYWDDALREFLGALDERGILSHVVLIYTSDHGEEFFDHGWAVHGHSLYEELVHVPLLMSFPPPVWVPHLSRTSRRVDEVVSSIDVLPTLLDFLHLPTPTAARGRSAAALAMGSGDSPEERSAYLEQIEENRCDIRGIRTKTRKCIITLSDETGVLPGRDKFFDLEADPLEKHNLIDQAGEEVVAFRELLAERINEVTTSAFARSVEALEPDAEQIEELRALGYIE
jgi:arylsulfatase A-like enzyme